MKKFAVGIDLGTTYCAVAVYRDKNAEIISNDQGNRTTPSCVAFTSTQRIVGEGATYQAVNNPENTIYGVKRLMGRTIDDKVIKQDIRAWPFAVVEEDGHVKVEVTYKGPRKRFCPEEISAAILEKMKSTAEAFLDTKIEDVVITCPAYFNNSQRQATKDAAAIAGLNVLRMINEPTAAAMAYGLEVNNVGRKNVLIFDFGGGTFDVSILTIEDQDYKVCATNGDTHLGGEDFDQRMVDHFVAEFLHKNNRDISDDKGLMRNLKVHCEKAKRTLSIATEAEIRLEGTNLTGKISRACFEDMNDDLFKKAIILVSSTLQDAEMNKDEIDDVVLVGGSSRIPKIQEMLSKFFGKKKLCQRINPDEAVALGAAIQAGMLQSDVFQRLRGLKLCDVCPLSLGTRLVDGSVLNIIKRNTPIPVKASNNIQTVEDFQTHFTIQIYEGERVMAKDNHFLGKFTVTGVPPMLRGEANAINTCEIDDNGILKVTTVIPSSGATNSMIITNKSRLSKDEAKRLADEAARLREEDAIHAARLVSYNSFERFLYVVKRKVSDLPEGGKQKRAREMVDEFSRWFKQNLLATKEEFDKKKCDLEDSWKLVQ